MCDDVAKIPKDITEDFLMSNAKLIEELKEKVAPKVIELVGEFYRQTHRAGASAREMRALSIGALMLFAKHEFIRCFDSMTTPASKLLGAKIQQVCEYHATLQLEMVAGFTSRILFHQEVSILLEHLFRNDVGLKSYEMYPVVAPVIPMIESFLGVTDDCADCRTREACAGIKQTVLPALHGFLYIGRELMTRPPCEAHVIVFEKGVGCGTSNTED